MSYNKIFEKQLLILNERKSKYGNSSERVGEILKDFFPKGLNLKTSTDHERMHIFGWIVGKLARYCHNFKKPHNDSLVDAINYLAILIEIDKKNNNNNKKNNL